MKAFDFNYNCIVEKQGKEIIVKGYNSPYSTSQDSQSILDIQYALKDVELEDGTYEVKLTCKFLENPDGSYNQIFKIDEINDSQR
jgi:hypothetical protein